MNMRNWILVAAALLASPLQAQDPTDTDREDYLAYIVTAARAEGDLVSDDVMLRLLVLQKDLAAQVDREDMSASELGLRAEADVLRARLTARINAAAMDSPELLASGFGCYYRELTADACAFEKVRLAELAGDNAYYHLALMAYAWKSDDAEAFLAHARAGAAATQYRSPYMDYYASLHERFRQVPDHVATSLAHDEGVPRAAIMAMVLSAAYAIPPYPRLNEACREATGELRGHCLAIAMLQLDSAQTPVEVSVAAGIIEVLGDARARELANQQRREAVWLIQQAAELHDLATRGQRPVGYNEYFEDYGTKGELEAARLLLSVNQRPATPPDDWNSSFLKTPSKP